MPRGDHGRRAFRNATCRVARGIGRVVLVVDEAMIHLLQIADKDGTAPSERRATFSGLRVAGSDLESRELIPSFPGEAIRFWDEKNDAGQNGVGIVVSLGLAYLPTLGWLQGSTQANMPLFGQEFLTYRENIWDIFKLVRHWVVVRHLVLCCIGEVGAVGASRSMQDTHAVFRVWIPLEPT